MLKPILSKRAFVPTGLLTPKLVREAERSLTFTEMTTDRISNILSDAEVRVAEDEDEFDYSEYQYQTRRVEVTVNEFRKTLGGVSLPRAWARKHLPDVEWVDRTVFPQHDIKYTGEIKPRDAQQVEFFRNLMIACDPTHVQDVLANAATGSGKTVAGIYVGWQLRTPTIIVVDSNKIANGWLKNFRQFFGENWTKKYVGRAQQDTCDYEGKAYVIAMAQSLASRKYRYPIHFYNHFGLLVVDEVQVFGGPHFSPILYMFNSRIRLHVTATNRTGPFGRLIKAHTGDPRVVSRQEVLKPHGYVLENRLFNPRFRCDNDGIIMSNIAFMPSRNARLANLIKGRGFDRDRVVLGLSDRTGQLLEMKRLLEEMGVPEDAVGIHAGTYQTNRYVLYYKLEGSNKRNRIDIFETYNEGEYFKNKIKDQNFEPCFRRKPDLHIPDSLYNRLQAGENIKFSMQREQYTPPQSELDSITQSCQIILATYQIFSKGVDVPRLDMGVELTPRGSLTQPLGRVLRLMDGKGIPEWYGIHDTIQIEDDDNPFRVPTKKELILIKFFDGMQRGRMKALKKAGAKIRYIKDENAQT